VVTVGIAGVLLALGAPALSEMMAAQRVKTATVDFYTSLAYARSEAIKRNAVVTVTPRAGDFANGYDLEAGGEVLKSQLGSMAVAITAPSGVALAFDGYGRLTTPARYQLELRSMQDSGVSRRCVVISPTGQPSIRTDTNHDGNCING
jgi:type IV fimbrial biogenesis protein FimT